jgi:tetratricopeptide (TPR) repeat protein
MGRHKSHKKKPRNSKNREYAYSNMAITFEPIADVDVGKLSKEIQHEISEVTWEAIYKGSQSAMERLEVLAREYPHIPSLSNNLAAAYQTAGLLSKSIELRKEILERFPDYLFARMARANLCFLQGEADKVLDCFDGCTTLPELYPERDVFHVSEVITFSATIGRYYCAIGQLVPAMVLYDMCSGFVEEEVEEHPWVSQLSDAIADATELLAKEEPRDLGDGTAIYRGIAGEITGPTASRLKDEHTYASEKVNHVLKKSFDFVFDSRVGDKVFHRFTGNASPIGQSDEVACIMLDYLVMDEGRRRETFAQKYRRKYGSTLDPSMRRVVDGMVESRIAVATLVSHPYPHVCVVYDHIAMRDKILVTRQFSEDLSPGVSLVYREIPMGDWFIARDPLLVGSLKLTPVLMRSVRMRFRGIVDLTRLAGRDRESLAEFLTHFMVTPDGNEDVPLL